MSKALTAANNRNLSAIANARNATNIHTLSGMSEAFTAVNTHNFSGIAKALTTTNSLDISDFLKDIANESARENHTRSPVDKDIEWSYTKFCYHSVTAQLEQLEVPIDETTRMKLFFISYFLVFMHVHTSFTLTMDDIILALTWDAAKKITQD